MGGVGVGVGVGAELGGVERRHQHSYLLIANVAVLQRDLDRIGLV